MIASCTSHHEEGSTASCKPLQIWEAACYMSGDSAPTYEIKQKAADWRQPRLWYKDP